MAATWASARGLATVTADGERFGCRAADLDLTVVVPDRPNWATCCAAGGGDAADLIIANAFLDLVEVPAVLPRLFDLVVPGGMYWFTINFDGETIFQPEHPADEAFMRAYHRSMDERVRFGRPAGREQGRPSSVRSPEARPAPASWRPALPTGWCHPERRGGYEADEAFFLHTILDTVAEALAERPEIHPAALADWIALRRARSSRGELVYLAHQLDFCGRRPFEGARTPALTSCMRTSLIAGVVGCEPRAGENGGRAPRRCRGLTPPAGAAPAPARWTPAPGVDAAPAVDAGRPRQRHQLRPGHPARSSPPTAPSATTPPRPPTTTSPTPSIPRPGIIGRVNT